VKVRKTTISGIAKRASEARTTGESVKAVVASGLSLYLKQHDDSYIATVSDELLEIEPLTLRQAIALQLPRGELMTRDTRALTEGVTHAPHQQVLAHIAEIRSAFDSCRKLAVLADRAADHIERASARGFSERSRQGGSVFIGHGRSHVWRELKDFVSDRLHLPWDEFNRVPVAGTTNIERLLQMLDNAGIAFIILTAEDERIDGALLARQNVVHEVGLFQGRLGFSRAIVMLENGCDEFSNIQGLGQIRFPKGRVAASFEEVRQVLEREGFLTTSEA
jgi:predicted nucleotide-binding protein